MRHVRRVIVAFCVSTLSAGLGSAALAGEEAKCAAQYTLEEQLVLEWAALGGDPHAQFAITQCAYPDGAGDLTDAERHYALKWLTLSVCDAEENDDALERDRITRKLKDNSDLSFRRFGGLTEDERLNRREKRFVEFRDHRYEKLRQRNAALQSRVGAADRERARKAIADDFSRMGPLGLLRLGQMSSCKSFGATPSFSAAAWSAAAEAWKTSSAAAVYGPSSERGWSVAREAERRFAALSAPERRAAESQKADLLRSDPMHLARLEREAALGRLEQLAFLNPVSEGAPRRSVTTAVQYALESMGFLEFVNGPDNDYGPSTIEAARRAQAHYGVEQSRWLSHDEVRKLVCDAATLKADPVSYYHLGVMYSQGWGFPRDIARARFAMDRASQLMDTRMSAPDELPAWKRASYPKFRAEIEAALETVENAWNAAPLHAVSQPPVTDETVCR